MAGEKKLSQELIEVLEAVIAELERGGEARALEIGNFIWTLEEIEGRLPEGAQRCSSVLRSLIQLGVNGGWFEGAGRQQFQRGVEELLKTLKADLKDSPVLSEVDSELQGFLRGDDDSGEPESAPSQPEVTATSSEVVEAPPPPTVAPATEVAEAEVAVADEGPTRSVMPDDLDLDLLTSFIAESRDHCAEAEQALLILEDNPADDEATNHAFRCLHSVKGTSGFFGLNAVTDFAHDAENLLSRVRDKDIPYDSRIAQLCLQSVDVLRDFIDAIEGTPPGAQYEHPMAAAPLRIRLAAAQNGELGPAPEVESAVAPSAPASAPTAAPAPEPAAAPEPVAPAQPQGAAEVTPDAQEANPAVQEAPAPAPAAAAAAAADPETSSAKSEVKPVAAGGGARNKQQSFAADANQVVRVRTARLDGLIQMIEELVIAQSMLSQEAAVASRRYQGLTRKATEVSKIVRELHDLGMSLRMVPLRESFQRVRRLVREVSQQCGKKVVLVTDGEDTELDRGMVDALQDPLVHMVRNSIDHGLEKPEDRVKVGKAETGTVTLSARSLGGKVVVKLKDDGKGLDRDKIAKKAIERGLIESDEGMTDTEVLSLIFAPGFSTADKVTDVSGRGVGMDVAKKRIKSLRGRIELQSTPGKGAEFTVFLPLTLALTDGMLLRVGHQRYIIPTIDIVTTFRPTPDQLSVVAGRGQMVTVLGRVLPIVSLSRLFGVEPENADPARALLIVVHSMDREIAVLVDELMGQQQVVAKPLSEGVGRVPGVAGTAILPDGRVGLIVDPPALSALALRHSDVGLAA